MACVLALLWVPVTSHCLLEQFPPWHSLLGCDTHGSASHQHTDCDQDACSVVESGLYVPTPVPVKILEPDWIPAPGGVVTETIPLIVQTAENRFAPVLAPPELPPSWLFLFRAAPAPRAPSRFL
jgi:hypothetical protein